MNIFLTSPDPRECALALDDKRVIKMALETAQLLSTALHEYGVDIGYKATHRNHPCAIWARQYRGNFHWLVTHGRRLCEEYHDRYEGRIHKSHEIIINCLNFYSSIPQGFATFNFNSSGFDTDDVFHDYKLCLVNKWKNKDVRPPTWRNREPPAWKEELWDAV